MLLKTPIILLKILKELSGVLVIHIVGEFRYWNGTFKVLPCSMQLIVCIYRELKSKEKKLNLRLTSRLLVIVFPNHHLELLLKLFLEYSDFQKNIGLFIITQGFNKKIGTFIRNSCFKYLYAFLYLISTFYGDFEKYQ